MSLDTIKQVLPVASGGIIVVSFLNLYFYYQSGFEIRIQNYIEVSEIIFSLTSMTSFAFVIGLIAFSLLIVQREKPENSIEVQPKLKERSRTKLEQFFLNSRFRILKKIYGLLSAPRILFGASALLTFFYAGRVKNESALEKIAIDHLSFEMSFFVLILVGATSFSLLNPAIYNSPRLSKLDLIRLFWSIGFWILAFIVTRNILSAKLILSGHHKFEVHLAMKDNSKVQTTDSIAFVGSTKNFHFFRNLKSNENYIYPASEVRSITMKQLRQGL